VLNDPRELRRQIAGFQARGFSTAIVNTVASGRACVALAEQGMGQVMLVHELPHLIREKDLTGVARRAAAAADRLVFPSAFVRDAFVDLVALADDPMGETDILPQGIYQPAVFDLQARARLRQEFGVPAGARLLIGLGYGDLRKGFDLFLQLARVSQGGATPIHCLWAGNTDATLLAYLQPEIDVLRAGGCFHLPGFRRDVADLLSAADVFILTSREDPFPSTVLEAMSAGLPTVAFIGSGGIPDVLAAEEAGVAVPMGDVQAMAEAATRLAALPAAQVTRRRRRLAEVARTGFDFATYARGVVDRADPSILSVSVAVPNYNYAHHLPTRLGSIFGQTLPVREVILLDDASSDDSLAVARATAEEWKRALRVIANDRNSGSVFRQWRRAAEAASGSYLWIAEADDDSAPQFLERAIAALDSDPALVFVFTDSAAINEDGAVIGPSYKP
jgi:hypothetical protein